MRAVLLLRDIDRAAVANLLGRYSLELRFVADAESIPGSYWGDSEAGLIEAVTYARTDTPLHSVLHEAAHFVCMTPDRRAVLACDAGGDDAEENAVCYLQIIWADLLPGVGAARLCADMDAWGYSFRLGSATRWFNEDATDARQWLVERSMLHTDNYPTFNARQSDQSQPAVHG